MYGSIFSVVINRDGLNNFRNRDLEFTLCDRVVSNGHGIREDRVPNSNLQAG